MKTKKPSAQRRQANSIKLDIYDRVTAQILAQLEQGTVPWKNPHTAQIGFPRNFDTSNEYQGINVLLLAMARFVSPHFLTYLQAKAMGGQVRKGEKGSLVVKYGEYQKKAEKQQDSEEGETRCYLKGYTVFNSCQIDGIDFPEPIKPEFTPSDRVKRAEALVAGFSNGPKIREGRGTRTCYNREEDVIDIPDRAYFDSEEKFYASLYHELCHASGSSQRLARPTLLQCNGIHGTGEAGQHYAKEELIAEIGASFLLAHAGIVEDEHEQNTAYLQSWLQVLKVKAHKRWIVEAASQAQKAVNYILAPHPTSSV